MTGESSSEGKSETELWARDKGVGYAYAYDNGNRLANTLGVRGIPHAVLVSKSGEIVWRGHPDELDDSTIAKQL